MASNIFLALGSNVGERTGYVLDAVTRISANPACKLVQYSSLYETSPYGKVDQPDFINAVIEIESGLSPTDLLLYLKELEKEVGRTGEIEKWGRREIDVDIIFYNDLIYSSDKMTIPHKECLRRDFVMVPLLEIAPDFIYPGLNKRISEFDITSLEKHIIHKIDFPINK